MQRLVWICLHICASVSFVWFSDNKASLCIDFGQRTISAWMTEGLWTQHWGDETSWTTRKHEGNTIFTWMTDHRHILSLWKLILMEVNVFLSNFNLSNCRKVLKLAIMFRILICGKTWIKFLQFKERKAKCFWSKYTRSLSLFVWATCCERIFFLYYNFLV